MGYTHYYDYAPEAISPKQAMLLCIDVADIIEYSQVEITGWDQNGSEEPEMNPEGRIAINGCSDDGHESFIINFSAPTKPESIDRYLNFLYEKFIERDRRISAFCKTAHKPYDEIVTAILLRAADLIPDFNISSDGYWYDWSPGRDLYSNLFGIESVCPWGHD